MLGLLYGILAMLLAFIAQYMGAIYAASFAVTGVMTGAIIAVFSMGVFMPFVNITVWIGWILNFKLFIIK